jgi:hypothetical protein
VLRAHPQHSSILPGIRFRGVRFVSEALRDDPGAMPLAAIDVSDA